METLVFNGYTISTPIKTILEDIRAELGGVKLKEIRKRGDYINVTCPHHSNGQERHPSCGVYIKDKSAEYGSFNCFTCGEHGSFAKFVALCFDWPVEKAKSWLINRYGVKTTETQKSDWDMEWELPDSKAENKVLDEESLEKFQSYHPYMDTRKLSPKVCEAFKIKYDPLSESLVFPVWDEAGRLVMLTRRSVKNKRFLIDKDKDKPVYLMNVIRKKNLGEVTICESQINALTLWGWGIPAVATFGCNVTTKQLDVLNHSELYHVYIAYDGDDAGKKGTKKLLKKLSPFITVDIIVFPPGRDVNDLTEEEFNSLEIVDSNTWLAREGENKDE